MPGTPARDEAPTREQVDAVMLAVQVLVGVAARSVADVEDRLTLPQLRVLVLVDSRGAMNLSTLAQAMGVHPSNASRACERLVAGGLLRRTDSATDRRQLVLELTEEGRALLGTLAARRRSAIEAVLRRLPATRRRALGSAMQAFGRAAGEELAGESWKLGWALDDREQ